MPSAWPCQASLLLLGTPLKPASPTTSPLPSPCTVVLALGLGPFPAALRWLWLYLSQLQVGHGPLATPRAVLEVASGGKGQQAEKAGGQHGVRHPGAGGHSERCCSVDCAALPSLAAYLCPQVFPQRQRGRHSPSPVAPQEPTATRSQGVSSDSGIWGHTWACLCAEGGGRGSGTGLRAVIGSSMAWCDRSCQDCDCGSPDSGTGTDRGLLETVSKLSGCPEEAGGL